MFLPYQSFKGSYDSQLDALSNNGSIGFKNQMLRSHTDSHIAYGNIDEIEVPGSTLYVTKVILLLKVLNVFVQVLIIMIS